MSRNAFSVRALKKKVLFDVTSSVKNKSKDGLSWSVRALIDNEYASLLFSQTFFFVLFLHVEQACKSFGKDSLTRISNAFA